MGKVFAAALVCALVLTGVAWAEERPELTGAGIYEVDYSVEGTGNITLKSIKLTTATSEIAARPGVAFGVCLKDLLFKGQPVQPGYFHPEAKLQKGRFWGVQSGFKHQGAPENFYGFVFDKDAPPAPGVYGILIYRPDDGSLIARQVFNVVEKPAGAAGAIQEKAQTPKGNKK
jgi:hypothetical protein